MLISKKNSIFFQINLFFVFIFFIINLLIIVQFLVDNKAKEALDENRYFRAVKVVFDAKKNSKSDDEINNLLQALNLKIANIDMDKLSIDTTKEINNQEKPIKIYFYNGQKYIQFIDKPFDKKPDFKDDFRHNLMPPPFIDSEHNFMPSAPPKHFLKNLILVDELNEDEFRFFLVLDFICNRCFIDLVFTFFEKKTKTTSYIKREYDFIISRKFFYINKNSWKR